MHLSELTPLRRLFFAIAALGPLSRAAAGDTVAWVNPAGGDWSVGANWDTGVAPGPTDDAIIDLPATFTVTLTNSATVNSVQFGAGDGMQTLSIVGGALSIAADSVCNGPLSFSAASLAGNGDLTVSGGMTWSGGTLSGSGALIVAPGTALTICCGGPFNLYRSIDNFGTITLSSQLDVYGATITNAAGATFNLTGRIDTSGSNPSAFVNAGTLNRDGGGESYLYGHNSPGLTVTNEVTGVINVNSGTLSINNLTLLNNRGTIDVDAGALLRFEQGGTGIYDSASHIIGGGAVQFQSGSHSFAAGVLETNRAIAIGAASVNFQADYSFPQAITLGGGTLTGIGDLTVSGGMTWSGGTLSGSGALIVAPGTALTICCGGPFNLYRSIDNFGTITLSSQLDVYGATITNAAGATFNLTGRIDTSGSNPSAFVNAGTLNRDGGGESYLYGHNSPGLTVTNEVTGVINVNSGTLSINSLTLLNNQGTIDVDAGALLRFEEGGTGTYDPASQIAGAGTVQFKSGSHSFAAGVLQLNRPIQVAGGAVTINEDFPVIQPLAISGGSLSVIGEMPCSAPLTLSGTLSSTGTLTVFGDMSWTGGALTGSGLIVVPVGAVLAISSNSGLYRSIDNFGTITLSSQLDVYGATITNAAGATFNLTGRIDTSGSTPSAFVNAGTLNRDGGGESYLYGHNSPGLTVTNEVTGVINVNSGTLSINNLTLLNNRGTIDVDAGALLRFEQGGTGIYDSASHIIGGGAVQFQSGSHSFAAGVLETNRAIAIGAASVNFQADYSFPQAITLGGGTLTGIGNLTVSGGMNWSGGTLSGSGALIVAPGTALTICCGGPFNLYRSIDNFGTITLSSQLDVYGATITNAAGATFNLTGRIDTSGSTPSAFVNAGTLNRDGGGESYLYGHNSPGLTVTNEVTGVINVNSGTLSINSLTLLNNQGTIDVDAGALLRFEEGGSGIVRAGELAGGGVVLFNAPGTLLMPTSSDAERTITIGCNLLGTGDIFVGLNREVVIAPGGVIDRSGQAAGGGCLSLTGAPSWGDIIIDGRLALTGGTIQNSNIVVRNDVTIGSCGVGVGGRISATGASTLQCCVFQSDGDRFFDVDATEVPQPAFSGNRYDLAITPDATVGEQGELLELRSEDFDHSLNSGVSGAYQLASSSGYNNIWTPQRLILQANSRLSLTNRASYDFNPTSAFADVLYVPDLIMHPNAVLNTGLQRIYYQNLLDQFGQPLTRDVGDPSIVLRSGVPHARILDNPLLGFSLVVIEMEDQCEFDVRIRKRTRDPADVQPGSPPFHEGVIQRIDPGDGYMQMCTRDAGNGSLNASSVAAHGAFARAGEVRVLVEFKYLFESDSNAELIVYLGDSSDVRDPNIPIASDPHFTQVATISPPASGFAGSIGSGQYAIFSAEFPRDNPAAASGSLTFARGTYVELELRGSDACVRIDDFDPQIRCTGNQCGDVTGNNAVAANDYLGYVAWYGRPVGLDSGGQGSTGCLDPRPMSDNYIDINDLLSADARLVQPPPPDLCHGYGSGTPQNGSAVMLPDTAGFLMLGKAGVSATQQPDLLYALNLSGTTASFPNGSPNAPVTPPSIPRLGGQHRADARLVQDGVGDNESHVYLLHLTQGIYRMDTGALVLAPNSVSFGGDTIHVGVRTYFDANDDLQSSPPILDAAFDPNNASIVYVAPILVQTNGLGNGYRAAAKLLLNGDSTFSVQQVYGSDPASDPCVNVSPPEAAVCDVRAIRELELDEDGNLFVLAAKESNDNDWLLVYETGSGIERRFSLNTLAPTLLAPTAMKLTADGTELYMAAAMNNPAATAVNVSRFSVIRSGGIATGITPAGSTQIDGMRHVLSLAEVPGASAVPRRISAFGFSGPTFTQLPYIPDATPPLSTYATALKADFAPGAASAAAAPIEAFASNAVALPLSAVYRPPPKGDTNCDGQVDFFDIDPFLTALFNAAGYQITYPDCDITSADCNRDRNVDFFDIDPFLAILFAP